MKLIKNALLIGLMVTSASLNAMESPSQMAQSLPTTIKVGLFGLPESINFSQIKQFIHQLTPANVDELNTYDGFIDGTVLDLVEDRKKQFGEYESEYDEIKRLLKEKGAQPTAHRKNPNEYPSIKL